MKRIVLNARKVLCNEGLDILENGSIIVCDGKIEKILSQYEKDQLNLVDVQEINLGNQTLMPGMIECHNHLCIDATIPEHLELLGYSNECELTLLSLSGLKQDLQSGVTTARCLADKFYIDVTMKEKIRKGEVEGPKLLVAGKGIKGYHGAGYIGYPHCGIEEVRRTTRENLKKGVDLIKLFITPGVLPLSSEFIPSFLTVDEMKVAVEEAAKLNIPVAAHCIGGQGLRDCIAAGVEVIEHVYAATEEDAECLVKSDCWVDFTSGIYLDPTREAFLSATNVEKLHKNRKRVTDCLRNVMESGVKFVLGTDAYHGFLYKEVQYAVDLGASKKRALQGITSNAAKVCRRENEIGSLKEGYCADIIAVKGDPLEDVSCLNNVSFVMKDGKVYKSETK